MTYRLGIDVGGRATDWVAVGPDPGTASPLASGTVESVVALVDGELRAGSQVAAAGSVGVDHVTTDFVQRLGDAEPLMVGGTPYGAESLIGWHVNHGWTDRADFFPVDRFRNEFNRPDIVRTVLSSLDEEKAIGDANRRANVTRGTEDVRALAPPPIVTV